MTGQIISIEDMNGPFQKDFQRIMKIIPEKDKSDKKLQRLLAFRLKLDGEAAVREYIAKKIQEIISCKYTGSLYAFLKDDLHEKECRADASDPNTTSPPDVA